MSQDERIAALEANSRQLRRQLEAVLAQYGLLERIRVLEAWLAKDSHNGGKPPSSDGPTCNTKRLRMRSGRKPGGQIGHRARRCDW